MKRKAVCYGEAGVGSMERAWGRLRLKDDWSLFQLSSSILSLGAQSEEVEGVEGWKEADMSGGD